MITEETVENGATSRNRYQYDDVGNQTRAELDFEGDGEPDIVYHFSYDQGGNLVRKEVDQLGDGLIDFWFIYTYDEQHRRKTDGFHEHTSAKLCTLNPPCPPPYHNRLTTTSV